MKPIIAIPCRVIEDKEYGIPAQGCVVAYVDSIRRAGGNPLLLPTGADEEELRAILRHVNGLLLTGGEDLCPISYRADPHEKIGKTSAERDSLELAALRLARTFKLPVLGVCRGLQLINVGYGGTLYQDIPAEIPSELVHFSKGDDAWTHKGHSVTVAPESRLREIVGADSLSVNTLHHQALKEIGTGLSVAAVSPVDRIVEAVEMADLPFGVAVQWHPEVLWQAEIAGRPGASDPAALKLFEAFVAAAADHARPTSPA